jgi:hypothetical protein
MTSEAVNTCVVFVARKDDSQNRSDDNIASMKEWLRSVSSNIAAALREAGWHDSDIAMAAFAHGVAMVANSREVTDCEDDRAALLELSEVVREEFPKFKVTTRRSL